MAPRRSQAPKRDARPKIGNSGGQVLAGFQVAPDDHRCHPEDIKPIVCAGSPVLGRQCQVCGRQWRYSLGWGGWPRVEVIPLTRRMPIDEGSHISNPTAWLDEPTGRANEMPSVDLSQEERRDWWNRYSVLRQERRTAARKAFGEYAA